MTPAGHRHIVTISTGNAQVEGVLALPPEPMGVVLLAHGSGSSRHSPRNKAVATALRAAGLGTLLMDLLSEEEAYDTSRRFDVHLLTERLSLAADWLQDHRNTADLALGLLGASTGAAAALALAAARPADVCAIVARGGRPDLASSDALRAVRAPTLFLVGELETEVIIFNHQAYQQLGAEKHMDIVPGASHFFDESGTIDLVASLAARWFVRHLSANPAP